MSSRAYRPPTGSRALRVPTGGRPPTGGLRTGMRPGSRSGQPQLGGALNAQITVPDRPVTQQGLGGMGTSTRGPFRQVQDKSYYLGILRSKIGELNNEVMKLSRELDQLQQESSTYLTYEKRAEVLAAEVEDLRGELADYNTLIDKLNTDTEIEVILEDYTKLCHQNEVETRAIDVIFAEKHKHELEINQLETAIEQERQLTETLVESMDEGVREKYYQLKMENTQIKEELAEKEKELETLTSKVARLEEEVASSELKQKAFQLHQQLAEVTVKREEWRQKEQETPEQERERLLTKVRQDNQEIASLEKKSGELQDKLDRYQEQLRQIEADLDEVQGERAEKLKELKTKEKERKGFLDTFEEQKDSELERIRSLEENVVLILEHISETIIQSENLPSTSQFQELQEDLVIKQDEVKKASTTAQSLESQNEQLQKDLHNVEELEEKIRKELQTLQESIDTMGQEIKVYSNLQQLQSNESDKERSLINEQEKLKQQKESAIKNTQQVQELYESENNKLSKDDTYTQLGNLERKLQYLEQNNFVMKEFIATRKTEGNYQQIAQNVYTLQQEYNNSLLQTLQPIL